MDDADEEVVAKLIKEAATRMTTDPHFAAQVEQTVQLVRGLIDLDWLDTDMPVLVRETACLAITIHDPMDGHPFF